MRSAEFLFTEPGTSFARHVTSQPEVNDLEVEVGVEHQIFALEISVTDVNLVHGRDCTDELKRVEFCDRQRKPTLLQKREQVAIDSIIEGDAEVIL